MMLPIQIDFTVPPETRWLMEWLHDGQWFPECVRNTIDQAISEGKRRLRCIPWVTWRVIPYSFSASAPSSRLVGGKDGSL